MHVLLKTAALLLLATGASASPWEDFEHPVEAEPQAVGSYSNGCLFGAEPIPDAGPGYQLVRTARGRYYGHPDMVAFIGDLGRRVEERGLGVMLIADVSMPRGGRFRSGHASHQIGLDADIWLRLDAPRMPPHRRSGYDDVAAVSMVDLERLEVTEGFRWKHAELIRLAALDERVGRIFVHPAIKKDLCQRQWDVDRSWLGKVRPWWGHHSHLHVRLNCPPGEPCKPQAPPPPGEGCGAPVEAWLDELRQPQTPKPKPEPTPTPRPPEACVVLIEPVGDSAAQQ